MNLWLIPFLPLAGSAVNGLFGRRLPKAAINAIAVGSVLLSFLWVLNAWNSLGALEAPHVERYFTWILSGALNIPVEFGVDRLTMVMLLIVTGIGSLIHIYAVGYMAHEGGYYRFFSYLNLFMFFMLVLVLGNNYLLLFVGWEGVGLCSYLLIGFYFRETWATSAGNKAFIVNRIGDFGFMLAMLLMFHTFGSLDFDKVLKGAEAMPIEHQAGTLTAICLLLLVGAAGKSAQIPLYVWLPDAMAGPTPVSALIHAATMVTAGVYVVARSFKMFAHAPLALDTVAMVGLATAVMAAIIGVCQNDIKKVFAYSTVSQLGYMFLGLGVSAPGAAIYHVMTHAFFKALLFLGAGSVIHALEGEQDIQKMGGLRSKIPITFWTLMCAGVAIAGFPFTSGYFSKDEILIAAHHHAPWMFWLGTFTAGLTAFYVFRCLFLTFFGEARGHHHPHESPLVMWGPLAVLALLSLGGGFFKVPHYLEPVVGAAGEHHDPTLGYIITAIALSGIVIAYLLYVVSPGIPGRIADSARWLYNLVYNKFFVDEVYDATVVQPVIEGSRIFLWKGVDAGFIDGIVNGVGQRAAGIGGVLRLAQSGNIRNYAAWVVLGSLVVIVAIGFWGGAK